MTANNHSEPKVVPAGGEPLTVAIVLDKSGSMDPLRETVVEAYNGFCKELLSEEGDVSVSLTSFDTEINHIYVAEPLRKIRPLRYSEFEPDGMTALYDAIAHAALETDRRLTNQGRADERVLLAVITDGHENSSSDYDASTLAKLVKRFEERGNWTFVYLGAAHASLEDARMTAASFGLKGGNAMRWSPDEQSAQASMDALAAGVKSRRSGVARRSDEFFADASQSESDYLGQGKAAPTKRARRRRPAKPAPLTPTPLSEHLDKERT